MDNAIVFLFSYPLDSNLYPMNSTIHLLNNQALINQSQGTLRFNDAIACEQALLFGRETSLARTGERAARACSLANDATATTTSLKK